MRRRLSGRFIVVNTRRLDVLRQASLCFSAIFPPFHPSRIPTALPSSSVTMYNPVPIFLTDPAWQSRISPTVPMLSVTGRPRGYAGYGGSPSGWRSARGRQCVWRCRLLSYIAPPLYAFEITLLLSANNGELCEWKTRKEKEGQNRLVKRISPT